MIIFHKLTLFIAQIAFSMFLKIDKITYLIFWIIYYTFIIFPWITNWKKEYLIFSNNNWYLPGENFTNWGNRQNFPLLFILISETEHLFSIWAKPAFQVCFPLDRWRVIAITSAIYEYSRLILLGRPIALELQVNHLPSADDGIIALKPVCRWFTSKAHQSRLLVYTPKTHVGIALF